MKAIIVVILGLFLTGCEVNYSTTAKFESVECPSPEVFISINQGESESQVSDKINNYSKVGKFEFKMPFT